MIRFGLILLLLLSSAQYGKSLDKFKIAKEKMNLMSKSELKTKYVLLHEKLGKMKKEEKREKKRKRIQKLSNNLIKEAEAESDPVIRAKILKTAAALNEHPFKTEKKLQTEALLKEKAKKILEDAEKEGDPKKQTEMIKKAETIIYRLKTGKAPNFDKKLTREMIKTASMEEVRHFAEMKEAELMALAKEAKKKDKHKLAEEYLQTIGDMITNPRKTLLKMNKRNKRRNQAKKKVEELLKKAMSAKSDLERKMLLDQAKFLRKHPNEGMKKYKKMQRRKLIKKAKRMAKNILKNAKSEKNPQRQRAKILAAKELLDYPLKTLREMKFKELREAYIQTVPKKCKKFVKGAYKEKLDFFKEKNISLDQLEKSAIVGLASVGGAVGDGPGRIVQAEHLNAMLAQKFKSWMKVKILAEKQKNEKLGPAHSIGEEHMRGNLKNVKMSKITGIKSAQRQVIRDDLEKAPQIGKMTKKNIKKFAKKKEFMDKLKKKQEKRRLKAEIRQEKGGVKKTVSKKRSRKGRVGKVKKVKTKKSIKKPEKKNKKVKQIKAKNTQQVDLKKEKDIKTKNENKKKKPESDKAENKKTKKKKTGETKKGKPVSSPGKPQKITQGASQKKKAQSLDSNMRKKLLLLAQQLDSQDVEILKKMT